jgi:hypothetical protein
MQIRTPANAQLILAFIFINPPVALARKGLNPRPGAASMLHVRWRAAIATGDSSS